jgi:hypothetical protein
MQGIRTLGLRADHQLAANALSDNRCWIELIDLAIRGDEPAVATISKMYGRLIYSMNRGRARHVDDHEGDVLEALWTAIQQRPASPDALLRSARRTMDQAATASKRAARTSTFDELPVSVHAPANATDDVIAQICTRDELTAALSRMDARCVRTFAARAGLIPHDATTCSPTARSMVRNVRARLAAA